MNQEKMTAPKLKAAALTTAVAAMLAFAFPAPPAQAQAPVTVSTNDNLGSAKYMDSTATWNPATNQVTGSTHIYVHHTFTGFTGGASATLNSADGHILAVMPQISMGVSGTAFGNSDRTVPWTPFAVDPKLASQVASITIMDSLAPQNRLGEILGAIGSIITDASNAISSIISILTSISGPVPGGSGGPDPGGSIQAITAKLPRSADLISHISALETTKVSATAVPPGSANPAYRRFGSYARPAPYRLNTRPAPYRLNASPAPTFHSVSPAPPRR